MTEATPAALPHPSTIVDRILAGDEGALSFETLVRWFAGEGSTEDLMSAADRLRRHRFGRQVHLCSIVNAKQGGCPEDCGFCSQSKQHSTHVGPERFLGPDEVVAASVKAERQHASALGLVTELHGIERLGRPRALMAFVGLVPSEASSGERQCHHQSGQQPCPAAADRGGLPPRRRSGAACTACRPCGSATAAPR